MSFCKDFVWGTASAAYQIEGAVSEDGRGVSIWDTFSHTPGKTCDGDTGDVACDSYHRWQEDIALLKQLGGKCYRFSVAWPRIAPHGETDPALFNEKGFVYYEKILTALEEAGITPCVTLYHWDLPQTLEDAGGWRNEATAVAFAAYAAAVAKRFKGRVAQYVTLNEVQCSVALGYGNGLHAPGLRLPEADQLKAWDIMLYAHCLAAKAIRQADPAATIGTATTGRVCYPQNPQNPADVEAARQMMFAVMDGDWGFTHQMVYDPLCLGRWPQADAGQEMAATLAALPKAHAAVWPDGKPDFIAMNIYNGNEVKMGAKGPEYCPRYTGFPRTALKWPVTPECMEWGPRFLCERYQLPVYISENGLACNDKVYRDGKVHDADRIDFLARYLEALHRAVQAGADVRGYYHWALLDNYEWHSGYTERFGLVFVDYPTGTRIPKDSFAWYQNVIRTNGDEL